MRALCAIAIVGAFAIAALSMAGTGPTHAATTCSGQYNTCFSLCRQFGFGRHRADQPHPQTAATCHDHCTGWKTECLNSGCWNGDLVQVCHLGKH